MKLFKKQNHSLKNGDNIKITWLPSCINVPKGIPNPWLVEVEIYEGDKVRDAINYLLKQINIK